MTATLDHLLDTLAAYPATDDAASFTLPPQAYTSPELFELEKAAIFRKEWLLIGREEQVAEPGDWFTFQILDDPILVVRGTDGKIRALANVCRHRYMPVALDGKGNDKRFVCAYHGWVYGTDGRLVAAPLMEGSLGFQKDKCALPEYRLETWQGFIFVNLDDKAPALAPQLHEADHLLANYRTGELVSVLSYDKVWEGNWKLATENGMEYYHHMALHGTTLEEAIPARGAYVEPAPASRRFTHTRCPFAADKPDGDGQLGIFRLPGWSFSEKEAMTSYAIALFPNISLAMSPDTNNWLSFIPLGPERTRVIGGLVMPRELADASPEVAAQRNDLFFRVNEEDAQATWRLQQVMRSTKAAVGPLNVREGTVAQFYKYLARTLVPDRVKRMKVAAE